MAGINSDIKVRVVFLLFKLFIYFFLILVQIGNFSRNKKYPLNGIFYIKETLATKGTYSKIYE